VRGCAQKSYPIADRAGAIVPNMLTKQLIHFDILLEVPIQLLLVQLPHPKSRVCAAIRLNKTTCIVLCLPYSEVSVTWKGKNGKLHVSCVQQECCRRLTYPCTCKISGVRRASPLLASPQECCFVESPRGDPASSSSWSRTRQRDCGPGDGAASRPLGTSTRSRTSVSISTGRESMVVSSGSGSVGGAAILILERAVAAGRGIPPTTRCPVASSSPMWPRARVSQSC
jgi:hypothetical protein